MKLWSLDRACNAILFLLLYLHWKSSLRDQAAGKKFAPISGSSSSIKILFIYENKNLSRVTFFNGRNICIFVCVTDSIGKDKLKD